MNSIVYDGSFDGFLSAVFDVYSYKFADVDVCSQERFQGNVFQKVHRVHTSKQHSERVWNGLKNKLSSDAVKQMQQCFLSELPGMENVLLQYIRYVFSSPVCMETDFSHPAVITVTQTARKVWREQHRMEAFVRFQKGSDDLYFSLIEPQYNVLPLIARHFGQRYADQRWLIYDGLRKYGLYYNLHQIEEVQIAFADGIKNSSGNVESFSSDEPIYQQLWQQYFTSVNIPARKNTRLHLQHMPRRYWKYLTEKKPGTE